MANTYTLIEAKTLGSAVASVTFSSIPQTYTHLQLFMSTRATQNVSRELIYISPNASTTNNARIVLFGYDSGLTAGGTGSDRLFCWQPGNSATANTFSNISAHFLNYTSSNYKLYGGESVAENNSTTSWIVNLNDTLWSDTAAITSIKIDCETSTFAVDSSFYLYGIKNS
jgi:hypothetical protein